MNLLRNNILLFFLIVPIYIGFGQGKKEQAAAKDTLKLSLIQAQQFALENNQSILNANLDVEAAKKKIWETLASGLPQASAKGAFSYTPVIPDAIKNFSGLNSLGYWMYNTDVYLHEQQPANQAFGKVPFADIPGPIDYDAMKWSLTGTVTVSQLIFSGSYLVGLQATKVYKNLTELNHTKSKQDILESVSNSYLNVLIARENRMIVDSTYKNLTKTFSDMQALNKQGFIEETDIDQMQITVSTVKSSLDFITRMEAISEKMLKLQLGLDLNAPVVLTDSLKPIIDALTIDPILATDFILDNNVNYQMLDVSVKTSELMLKLHKSEFLPDLAAFYQYQNEFNDKAFTFTPPHVIGVSMNIPLFSSGARLAKVSQAKIDLLKAQNNKNFMSNSLRLDFESSKSALLSARDKYQTESIKMGLSKRIYNKALIKYANGLISSTDLNQIQNQYLTEQSNYYTAIQNLITSKKKLEKMLTKN
jgi:outer membrane protein